MHVVEVVIDVSIRGYECDNLLPCVGLQILRRPNGHFRLVCLPPRPHDMITAHTMQGRDVQLDHWTEWIGKVKYPGRNMFRVRNNEHEHCSRSEPPGASRKIFVDRSC
jgi:hypothetical protein